jgi:porin
LTSSATQPSVNAEAEGALAAATPDQNGTSSNLPEPEQTPQPQTLPAQTPPSRDPASVKLVWAQFAESPVSGDADKTVLYSGKLDAYLDLSGATFGLDDSVNLHINPELRYGNSANGLVGLIPSNTVLFYPDDEGEAFDLSVNITKRWSNGTSLTLGKVNVLGPAKSLPISGGGGTAGFQNLAFALPPSAIVPGSIIGALLSVPTEKALFRVWVFDPDLQSQRSGLGDLFSNGVAGLASVTVPTKLAGKPGFFAVKVMGSTRSNIAARSLPPELIPAPGSGFGEKSGEFAGVLAAGQYLTGGPGPGGGIGIFGQVFASAGDPTFLDISGQLGIAGTPPGRPQDRFGLGWFRYSLTDGLIDALAQRVPLEDEEGIEAFYTLGLKDKLHLSINLQVVDSAVAPRNRGAIASMRLVAEF